MPHERDTIIREAEARRELAVQLLRELVRLETVNPPGNEKIAADYCARFCTARKIPYKTFDPGGGRTSLIAEIGTGRSPRLFIPAHTDVVPVGDGWTVPALEGLVKDGYVWGRGTTDDKGALAGLLAAADYLKTIEGDFKGTLLLGAVADEEHGSTHGLEWLLKTGAVKADFAFVPDMPSFLGEVEIAEKGLVNVRVTFLGKQAHSSTPEEGVSALNALAEMIHLTERWKPHGSERKHPLLSPTTAIATQAEAGVAHNIVPGKASCVYNVRFLPGQSGAGVAQELRKMAEQIATRRRGVTAVVEKLDELPPSEVPRTAPVAQALAQALAEITGKPPRFTGIGGATVCKQLIAAGIPAVAFGPGDPKMPHMADERLAIDELVAYTAVVIGATLRAVGG